jgi:hypothetical protein
MISGNYNGTASTFSMGGASRGNPPAVTTAKSVGHISNPGSGTHYSSQTITGSAALTPPAPGMYLVNIRIVPGVGPGALKILYSTPNIAVFPYTNSVINVATTGVQWGATVIDYPVNWKIDGTNVPAAAVTVVGKAMTECELTYSTTPGTGPDISAYRASTGATLTSAAASTVTNTVTWESAPAHAKSILFLVGWGSGTIATPPDVLIQMPAVGPYQQTIQGGTIFATENGAIPATPVEQLGDALTLVVNMVTTSLGGATTLETLLVAYY